MNKLAEYLQSGAQGASNAAASTVSAPVDLIAWLLRKGGLDVPEDAVGSTNWMVRNGLVQQPQNKLAGFIGEGLGAAIPGVVAAKAPQIAGALLKGGENLAAQKTLGAGRLGAQRGAIDPEALGLPVNKDGTVTLLHGTTPEGADSIALTKIMRSKGEPNVYFTTADDAGYGTGALVKVDVDPRLINLDDEFPSGRMDFSADAPRKWFRVKNAKRVK